MACSGCGGGLNIPGEMIMTNIVNGPSDDIQAGLVRLEYTGNMSGNVTYTGKATGIDYYAGNNSSGKYIDVDPADAPGLVALSIFRVVDLSHLKKADQKELMAEVNAANAGAGLNQDEAALAKANAEAALAGLDDNGLVPPDVDVNSGLGGKDGLPTNQPNVQGAQVADNSKAEAVATGQTLPASAVNEKLQDQALEDEDEDGLPKVKVTPRAPKK